MNADQKRASDRLKAFTILTILSYGGCVLAIVVGAVSESNDAFGAALILFVFASLFSLTSCHFSNVLSIIDLQKRLSALEAGSSNDSKSQS